jgi:DNA-binding LacI/PurR family transcriptional regulator
MNLLPANPKLPKYVRVRKWIESKLQTSVYLPGDRLPGEAALAKTLGVSAVTIRQAFQALTREGLLYRSPYRGTFVSKSQGYAGGQSDLLTRSSPREILILVGRLSTSDDTERYRSWEILQAFEKHMSAKGFSSRVKYLFRGSTEPVLDMSDRALPKQARAAFLLGDQLTEDQQTSVVEELKTSDFFLVASDYIGRIPIHKVQESLFLGVELALDHFKALGYSRIGFLTYETHETWGNRLPWIEERLAAFHAGARRRQFAATNERVLKVPMRVVTPQDTSEEMQEGAGKELARQYIASQGWERCDALLALNDSVAFGFRTEMIASGHHEKLPYLVGFDNLPLAQAMGLTTVVSPTQELGNGAAKIILEFLREGPPSEIRTFQYSPHLLRRSINLIAKHSGPLPELCAAGTL